MIPFPWEPTSSEKVLPFNYDIPAAPGNSISITACRGGFEPASLIIFAREDMAGITITTPTLYSAQGNSIPASATDVHLVKVWYQATDVDDIWLTHIDKTLKPELLLKDDSLVRVDYTNQMNYLRVSVNGVQQYIDITSPSAAFPSNAQVHDAQTLQPFSMAENENKQIWLTVHIPENTPAGDYRGDITIAAPGEIPVLMNFTVTVLPFDLESAPLEYGLYYRGEIPADVNGEMQKTGITFEFKTPKQYRAEIQDMKDHGVLYPTLNNEFPYWNSTTNPYLTALNSALTIRRQVGLPLNNIYYLRIQPRNPTDQASLSAIAENTRRAKSIFAAYGCRNMYLYGIDEASGSVLQTERTAWQTVKQNGGKMFVAGYSDLIDYVGDLLDVPVLAHSLDTSQAARWHRLGKKLFNYANPQVGVENPELYRRNYGFALWNAGYDGEMDYAYQHAFGNIWNDFDSVDTHFRDHVFAYPTTDGVIDTIQWEGFREGVDDTRYLATLIKKEGNNVSAKTIVSRSLTEDNMPVIRRQLVNRILSSSTDPTTPPVAGFTATPVSGTSPLTVTFRDASTNSPASWRWSFGDGSSVNATARNPVHTYSAPGSYTVTLTVTNAAGSDMMTRTGYITVTRAGAGPVASFTASPVSGTSPLKVRFSDTSSNSPASWNWSIRNTAGGAVVYFGKKNLLSLNQANGAEAGISAEFQPNNGGETLSSSTEYAWQGKRSIKIVTPGTNTYEGMYLTPKVSVSPSTRYTGSVYVRGAKGGEIINLYLEEKTSGNTHISFKFSGDITLTTRWQRIAITSPASAGCRKLLIGVLSEDTDLATFYVDGLQLEKGSSATVWTGDAVQNPGYTLTTPGTYTVTLRVTNAAGSNVMTRNGYIRVA